MKVMSKFFHNKAVSRTDSESHVNFMGGKSFDISNPIVKLRIMASSSFFGEPMYYNDAKENSKAANSYIDSVNRSYLIEILGNAIPPTVGKTPAELMEEAIDNALSYSVEGTLREAVRLRNEENMRTTPQVILVRAAHHKSAKGTGLVNLYSKDIIKRADEPSVGLAYHVYRYGKACPIPNSLKKAWRNSLQGFNDYSLAKYRMENKEVKTVDVVNLVHPKSFNIDKLMKDQLRNTENTWEAIISAEGSNKESWTKALDVMGHMALLRNLRNLIEKGVEHDLYLGQLVEGAPTGKQFPFRYYSAYNVIKQLAGSNGRVLDALEECMELSIGNMPKFDGRLMSLCDNSGSAQSATTSSVGTMRISQIANLSAVIAGKCATEGHIGVFGDSLQTFEIRKKSSIFEQTEKADNIGHTIGQGTENGIWLFWDKAIKEKQHWDHVFIFSDMQAGHGGLYGLNHRHYQDYRWHGTNMIDVPKLINTYRKQVNPNVMVYCTQVAGYSDTIMPEFYDKTFILSGWSESLFRFASEMSKIFVPQKQ